MAGCNNCGGGEWVCEDHPDTPWHCTSNCANACRCGGAGAPCGVCNLRLASAAYSEPWRELAVRAIEMVEDAVRETAWGRPTFGPDYGEELRAEYSRLLKE